MSQRARNSRRERGATLLIAMAFVAVVGLATLMSLKVVSTESDIQAASRQQRQAYFAAEAGLAEARERLTLLVGNDNRYTNTMRGALSLAQDLGDRAAANAWYDVFRAADDSPWVPYTMEVGAALDGSELPAGVELPAQANVRYRVFLRDDNDVDNHGGVERNQTFDANGRVWLVAVGEVTRPGGQPTRAVVQALIDNGNANPTFTGETYSQKGGDAAKSFTHGTSGIPALGTVRPLGGP